MTSAGRGWNEDQLSEAPAVAQLQKLGFTYVAPEVLEGERASVKEVLHTGRLATALEKLHAPATFGQTHLALSQTLASSQCAVTATFRVNSRCPAR